MLTMGYHSGDRFRIVEIRRGWIRVSAFDSFLPPFSLASAFDPKQTFPKGRLISSSVFSSKAQRAKGAVVLIR